MNLSIEINKGNINIRLQEKSKTIDEIVFPDMRNLTEELLMAIDKLLKRNGLNISEVARSRVNSDQSDSFTTTRIAKITADVITHMKAPKRGIDK
jgi:hypothetical protein